LVARFLSSTSRRAIGKACSSIASASGKSRSLITSINSSALAQEFGNLPFESLTSL
jgi:hypothetical protein